MGEYINCYNLTEGYYIDKDVLKKCYYTCKTCELGGDNLIHNCIECNQNFSFRIKKNNYYNCMNNDDKNIVKYLLSNIINEAEKSTEEEIKYYDFILKNLENILISDNFNTLNIDNGEDEIIRTEKLIITLTTYESQKNN